MKKTKSIPKRFRTARLSEPNLPRPEVQVEETNSSTDTSSFDGGIRLQVKPIGASGTELSGGYFSEEYLTKLRGRRGMKVFDEMRRSESQVSMLLNAIMNPIKSAPWEVQLPKDVDNGELHRDFIECCRTEMIDWETHLHEALTFVAFGFSIAEVIHQVIFNHPKFGTVNGLKGLAFRSQKTIERWIVSDETGNLEFVEQMVHGDYARKGNSIRRMDAQHLLVFTLNKEGDNYEGIGALRPMYGPYFRKALYQKIIAMGIEQNAKGTIVGTVPSGIDSDDEKVAEFKRVLQNFVAHEASYMLTPEGWTIDVKNNNFDPEKINKVVQSENTEMINAVCANFLALGTNGGGGAFALSNDLSDFMLNGITCIANIVSGVWNRVLIPNLIKLNYGPQLAYPQLVANGISDKAGKELAEILSSLITGKVLKPDDKLEESMRKRYNLPEADPTTARDTSTAPAAFPGQSQNVPDPNVQDPQAAADAMDAQLEPTQLAEKRLKLSEKFSKIWRDNKAGVKELMQTELTKLLAGYNTQLRKDWKDATEAQKPTLALKLEPKGVGDYKAVLREELAKNATQALERAKMQTPWLKNKNIKLAEKINSIRLDAPKGGFYDALPPKVKRLINANAELIASTQNADIQKMVSFQYGNSFGQDNIDQIINDIDTSVLPSIEGSTGKGMSLDAAAGNVVAQVFEQARSEWFFEPEVLDTLASFTYKNDVPVSAICQELVGTTLDVNDPLLSTYATPLHHNCDGEWVPNQKGADGNPDIKRGGIPLTQKALDSITLCECHGLTV